MAYNGRIIDVYYDIDNGVLKSADFFSTADAPEIRLGEAALLRLRVKTAERLPFAGFSSALGTVTAAADSDFLRTNDLMLVAESSDINVNGDWADADSAKGRFSIRLNADNATFQTRLGTKDTLSMTFELHFTPTGESYEAGRVTFDMTAVNTVYLDATPPAQLSAYYTKTEIDSFNVSLPKLPTGSFVWWGYGASTFASGIDTDGTVSIAVGAVQFSSLVWMGDATSITCSGHVLTALPAIPPSCVTLVASNNALTQTAVDNVLANLVTNGLSNGTVNLSGGTNAVPSVTGLASAAALTGDGWTVVVNS